MKVAFNNTTLEMTTKVHDVFTDGQGLDTVVIIEGTVNGKFVAMNFDGQFFTNKKEAIEYYKKNAWLETL
jgi:hypothetical protein